ARGWGGVITYRAFASVGVDARMAGFACGRAARLCRRIVATFQFQPSPLAAPSISSLDNGLRLVVTPMPFARSVALSVYVAAGSRYEATREEAGLSHFLEHLCFKGTARRPKPLTISMEIDAMGGNLNAATNRELTVYYDKMTPEYLPQAVDLLA